MGCIAALALLPALVQAAPQRIVGYLPRYRTIRPDQFKGLTHVIVFSVVPEPVTGTLKVFTNYPATGEIVFEAPPGGAGLSSLMIDQVVAEATNYGVRVGLCIGGTAVASQFQQLEINGTTATFATNVCQFALAHGIKEINIDWEQPSVSADPGRATNIFAALSGQLKPHGIDLTAAWTASTSATYALQAARLCRPYSDAVYVMSYKWDLASFQTRFELYTKPESEGGQGYPPEKVCPGVQFFGRDEPARTLTKTYAEIVALAGDDLDPATNSMVVSGKTLLFTGQDMLGSICDYSKQVGGGVMIWEIGQDADPAHPDALTGVLLNHLGMTTNTATPHWWLRRHGITNDFENAVLDDPDHDGHTTAQEYISDTNPLDGNSRLELAPAAGGFRFEARPDRYYTVFNSADLSPGSWASLPGYPILGAGGFINVPIEPGVHCAFYCLGAGLTGVIPAP